ncbi:MAG TPA: glycosyltransferase, partial [Actinomycetota bacterium]|nr:glycosyltransferase [Actinomycetota bacterium]
AFPTIKALHPPARLVVGGDGPDREACERAIPGELAGDVEFLGRVTPEAVAAVLGNAAVVALPALGGESFGIVLLEAMAAGRPVVATSIPGYAAVARHEREALLVPPGDSDALAAAVATVLRDPGLGDALVDAGRRRAAEFDWDRVVEDVEKAYRDAIAARRHRAD